MRKSLYNFFVERNVKGRINSHKMRETIKSEVDKEMAQKNYNPRLARHKSLLGVAIRSSK